MRLDSIWGFCDLGANSEGPVGSPTAWKNKRPRPVAVLIPGYNISKICDDTSISYFRRIFWKSLFRHFPDSLDVGFGGLTLVPYVLAGPNGDTKLLIWPLPLIYVKSAMTQVLDFVLKPNCTFACWFLLWRTRVPQDPLRLGRTRRYWPLIDPIQGYNISKICDDTSPRFFVRLDSIWGFYDLGANSEGPVGSPTAWKNKRPRPVAVLIPGYNICKICDVTSLSYFRRIFWTSLFRHFPDSLDVGFGGSYPRFLRPGGT